MDDEQFKWLLSQINNLKSPGYLECLGRAMKEDIADGDIAPTPGQLKDLRAAYQARLHEFETQKSRGIKRKPSEWKQLELA
jgi:hypothetical protein